MHNTNALCLKELDMSKTQIDSDHITPSFYQMLKSDFCTLKVLNLRDNFIKQTEAEHIVHALKLNKTLIKMNFELNPVKQSIIDEIEKVVSRNHNLDTVNDKTKNIVKMAEQQKQAAKQR